MTGRPTVASWGRGPVADDPLKNSSSWWIIEPYLAVVRQMLTAYIGCEKLVSPLGCYNTSWDLGTLKIESFHLYLESSPTRKFYPTWKVQRP